MRNFLKIVATSVLRLNLFLKDSIATAARLLRLTQPSVQRTSKGVSYDSTRTRHLTTGSGLRAMNEGLRLISVDEALKYGITDSSWQDFGTTEQSEKYLSLKKNRATTSSSEKETI